MQKQTFNTKKGPEAKGPYSSAVVYGETIYVSGQGPVDPETGQMVKGSVEEEARRAFENVKIILEEMGSSMEKVLKVTLYLSDMDNFSRVNEVYKDYFGPDYPARTCIQAGRLPFDIKVEVDVIAAK